MDAHAEEKRPMHSICPVVCRIYKKVHSIKKGRGRPYPIGYRVYMMIEGAIKC